MTNSEYLIKLQQLKLAEQGAIGGLKGRVIGLLMRHDIGLDLEERDWRNLRAALDAAETTHQAVVNHLMEPVDA